MLTPDLSKKADVERLIQGALVQAKKNDVSEPIAVDLALYDAAPLEIKTMIRDAPYGIAMELVVRFLLNGGTIAQFIAAFRAGQKQESERIQRELGACQLDKRDMMSQMRHGSAPVRRHTARLIC